MAKSPIVKPSQGKEVDSYETFDSGDGPCVSSKDKGNYSHRDAQLSSEGENAEHGDVPEMPQKKR